MRINKITRLLLSMAVAAMLVGFTVTAQEKKVESKEVKPATEMKKDHKEHKTVMKTKAAVEKKKAKHEETKKEQKKPD